MGLIKGKSILNIHEWNENADYWSFLAKLVEVLEQSCLLPALFANPFFAGLFRDELDVTKMTKL